MYSVPALGLIRDLSRGLIFMRAVRAKERFYLYIEKGAGVSSRGIRLRVGEQGAREFRFI